MSDAVLSSGRVSVVLQLYPWVKAFHVVSIIAWMAGLLYLPRLFVYHCEAGVGSAEDLRFQEMERRLLRGIMNPAMIAVFVFGAILAATPGAVDWSAGWIYVKLLGVASLTGMHHAMGLWRKGFLAGENPHAARFYRIVNEIPALVMVVIVTMVVVKPF
jgi:putative membrane protein